MYTTREEKVKQQKMKEWKNEWMKVRKQELEELDEITNEHNKECSHRADRYQPQQAVQTAGSVWHEDKQSKAKQSPPTSVPTPHKLITKLV